MGARNKRVKKNWTELNAESSWRMFRIISEFVEGFEKMEKFGPCISIFGSAREKPEGLYYAMAQKVASLLVADGYGIITGGGPGIMEAGNKGASLSKGKSVGLHIELKHEKDWNKYIDADKLLTFKYFFARKVMFIKYAQGFIYLPGGFGTLDELFELLTLVQTNKIDRVPIILMGVEYWKGLLQWIQQELDERRAYIHHEDLHLFHLTDSPEEAVSIINQHYASAGLKPNF